MSASYDSHYGKMDDTASNVDIMPPRGQSQGQKDRRNFIFMAAAAAAFGVLLLLAVILLAVVALKKIDDRGVIQTRTILGSGDSRDQPAAAKGNPLSPYNPGAIGGRTIWNIMVGHDYGAHEYIDKKGYLAGFNQDLLRAVCEASGTSCMTIWDLYINCLKSEPGQHTYGGIGLMGRWYDGCISWYTTVPRLQIYKFSQPYLRSLKSYFIVKKNRNSEFVFDKTKKIGFLDGWASDEKCLARYDMSMNIENVYTFIFTKDIVKSILNGTIDAGFAAEPDLEPYPEVEILPTKEMSCMIAGNGMMMRKDSSFDEPFNSGLNQIISNGQYGKICDKTAAADSEGGHAHKGKVRCLQV